MRLLSASWVIPLEGPPITGGALVFSGGRILGLGRVEEVAARWPGAVRLDLPGYALFPALVNGHAHLELTGLGPPPRAPGFSGWVLEVIGRKQGATASAYLQGVRDGARACLAVGQGLVADIVSVPGVAEAYPQEGPEILAFPEVIAPCAEGLEGALERARARVPPSILGGLSPHAPYTAGEAAYRRCLEEAQSFGGLLMTHLAESEEEVSFCLDGTGGIRERLYATVAATPPPVPALHPLAWLDRLGALGPRTVLVHAVHLRPRDPGIIARRGASVVLCPRSNRHLGVGSAPGRALLDAGVVVGLGTDSVLSAGSLDLWEDVAAAVEDYGWTPAEALRAAALGGAQALGQGGTRGAFAPGRRADILAIPVTGAGTGDVAERVLAAPRPAGVWLGGRLRYRARDFAKEETGS